MPQPKFCPDGIHKDLNLIEHYTEEAGPTKGRGTLDRFRYQCRFCEQFIVKDVEDG